MTRNDVSVDGPAQADDTMQYVIVRKRHPGRYVAVAIILLLLAGLVNAFVNGKIAWNVVGTYLFDPDIIAGTLNAIFLTVLVMTIGTVLAICTALMVGSENPVLRSVAHGYMFVFRAIPMLLQLLLWYNLALIFPTMGIPFLFSAPTTQIMTPFVAALLALSIAQGAYLAEIIRSGLISVGRGQHEAAISIGMTYWQAFRRVILPQALRVIVPPLGNETIGMVKFTSLASVIQYREVLYSAQSIYFANGRVIEMLLVCAFWYALIIGLLSVGQSYVERHFNKASRSASPGRAN